MVCTITTSSSVTRKAGGATARRNRGRRLFMMVVSSCNGSHHALYSDDTYLLERDAEVTVQHLLLSAHKSIGAHVCGADQFLLQYATQN